MRRKMHTGRHYQILYQGGLNPQYQCLWQTSEEDETLEQETQGSILRVDESKLVF